MILIHQGFDTFDFSLKTNIPVPVAEKFQQAKDGAQSTLKPKRLEINGASFLVREHGAKGGFRFVASCEDPESTWFLKYPKTSMPWGISVSIGSNSLALLGLEPCLEGVFEALARLTRSSLKYETSVARFDYAQDFLVEGFEPDPDLFIHHNRTKSKSHHGADVVRVAGAVQSVTVGRMPGAQVIIYDKRKEVIDRQRSKRIWWQIWNANLKSQALQKISPENTRSRIWRIEARAGKKYLKERMNIRSIDDLRSRGGDALLRLTENIRYTSSTPDSNRSRWPNAQIWDVYRRNLSSTLSEMISGVEPSLLREMRRADLIQDMKAQMLGCSAVYANAQALDQSDLALTASAISANLDAWLNEDLALFGEKLALAGERYSFSG